MIKLIFGSLIYFAGPIGEAGFARAGENESAIIQQALKINLGSGGTGTYVIPYPGTQTGTTLYGNGPVATVHFNSNGFPLDSGDGMIWGFALYLVAAVLMAAALSQLDRRVVDFKSRATIVICFGLAAASQMVLTDPIFQHWDWRYCIFAFIGNAIIFSVGGLILARWFMPVKAELAPASPAYKVEEASSGEEVPPVGSTRL
jgi:hypothetical protein